MVLVPFYRGAVVFSVSKVLYKKGNMFSSPFIEERLYLKHIKHLSAISIVLVPFYRGAVVFKENYHVYQKIKSSRPLLSRSGCI